MNKNLFHRLKSPLALLLTAALVLSFAGCDLQSIDLTDPLNEGELEYVFAQTDTYHNGADIEGQWGSGLYTGDGEYGIGDPFVLRYDGRYYMYPSSDWSVGEEQGVKVFSSDDLVNWTYEGFAATGAEVDAAYAPEVVYYNGYFYMTESQAGRGHYVLRSESPTGPFTVVTDNFGRSIDGAFWVGDDGDLYFMYASNNTIQIAPIDLQTMTPGIEQGMTASLNGWTEGPGLFRRGDNLYLTYAGNAVTSAGYRVGYSYQMGTDPLGQFILAENNILLLSTGPDAFQGLGHSSNVIGPDLDSWYTAYHNLVAQAGPQRRYMVDRLVTNGAMVLANGPTYSDVSVPERPDYETRGTDSMTASGTLYISDAAAEAVFTAEFNFVPTAGGKTELVFSRVDENNYMSLVWDDSSKTLTLSRVKNGSAEQLGSATADSLVSDRLHTVRIEQGANRLCVYIDSMRKLDETVTGTAGHIGVGGDAEFSYIAFTNDAFGTSDFEAVKIVEGAFPAVHYLKGENRGFSIKNAAVDANGIRQGEKENTNLDESTGIYSLVLDTVGDWVKYAIHVTGEGFYGLSGTVTAASAGAKIQVIVDSKDVYTFTVPNSGLSDTFVNLMLGQIPLTEGDHTLKLRLAEGSFEATQFLMEATNPTDIVYENALDEINEQGWTYVGNWKIIDGAHTAKSGDTAYAYAGDERMTDFTVEVEVAMTEEATIYDAGILLRAQDHVLGAGVDESFRGYYLSIRNDQITLNRYNYGSDALDLVSVEWQKDEFHKIKATVVGNRITVYVDDMETPVIDYCDSNAFLTGQIALCSNKAGCAFKNIKIQTEKQS